MSLEDLNKELYDPKSDIEKKRTHEESPFDPETAKKTSPDEFIKEDEWVKPRRGLTAFQRKIFKAAIFALSGIIIFSLVGYLAIKYKRSSFSEDRVFISIEGPEEIGSMESASYVIRLKNNNRAGLEKVLLNLNYAENFYPEPSTNIRVINSNNSRIEIDKINPYGEEKIDLKGKFYAPRGHLVYIKASLEYTPSSFSSIFHLQSQIGVKIKTSPISLEISAPLEAADGNNVEYSVIYKNNSHILFEDVRIKTEYAPGFEFVSANPQPSEGNNSWFTGNLGPGGDGKITIRGIIRGSISEGKIIKAYIGSSSAEGNFMVYNEIEKITKLVVSPLVITQSVSGAENGSIDFGDQIQYTLKYRNNGNLGLRDVIVNFEIDSPVFDYTKFKLQKGYYDGSKKLITWKASDYPELSNLAPGAEGSISFSIPVMPKIPINKAEDKNFIIKTIAKIDSPDVPSFLGINKIIASNTLELKLNSRIFLESSVYYQDDKIKNYGPLPPQTGEETSITVNWKITNVLNDVASAKVSATLPTGIKWTGKIHPAEENLFFNERTNHLIWEVGKIGNATGILTPKKEVSFQVAFVPQVNQTGSDVQIFNDLVFSANDLFTGRQLFFNMKSFKIDMSRLY